MTGRTLALIAIGAAFAAFLVLALWGLSGPEEETFTGSATDVTTAADAGADEDEDAETGTAGAPAALDQADPGEEENGAAAAEGANGSDADDAEETDAPEPAQEAQTGPPEDSADATETGTTEPGAMDTDATQPAETADGETEDTAQPGAEEDEPIDIASIIAAGDPEAGEGVFQTCRRCHMIGEGAENRVGPVLNDVIGRQAGTYPGFDYSDAMVQAGEDGLVWNGETLRSFLQDPQSYVEGTRMPFTGLPSETDRRNVVAYIAQFSQ